ncbi:pyruvate formate lyase family protein [Escherichia coli]
MYIQRDLEAGKITEQEAQEMVDHLVMKLPYGTLPPYSGIR